jgi:hypothetical protein
LWADNHNESGIAAIKAAEATMDAPNTINARLASRRKVRNRVDPIYIFLDRLVFQRLFQPPKRSVQRQFEQVAAAEIDFLVENLNKHRIILWLNIILTGYLAAYGLDAILKHGDPAVVVTGLLAPAMITGGAWYAVSFGGIPEKFINSALVLTFCMFLAFTLSMTLLISLLCKLTPWPIGAFFLIPMYGGLYIASVLYDNLDGLKIGLDTALLKFSRAALNYYQKHGLVSRKDVEADEFEDPTLATSEEIALFTHHMKMLETNLAQLDRERTLQVANHLIASSTDILFSIVNLSLPKGSKVDRGEEEYAHYVRDALDMNQDEVDTATIRYLEMAIDALKVVMGPQSESHLESARSDLKSFVKLQKRAQEERARERTSKATSQQEEQAKQAAKDRAAAYQKLADHLFSQVFKKLLSLINAHKDIIYKGFRQARSYGNE